ncbi:MAG: hypothetical protein RLP02_34690 [Coleofasciculus sp. C2-GNP5-27]
MSVPFSFVRLLSNEQDAQCSEQDAQCSEQDARTTARILPLLMVRLIRQNLPAKPNN